jgi:TonB-dependent starch-binding outer membrane protein SusC
MKRRIIFKRGLLLLFSLMFITQITAQNITISGTVLDATNGEPLPGATVVIPFTTIGTATNYEGVFSLEATMGEELLVSFVGYESQTIQISDITTYEIALIPASTEMDELVVIGYGKVKKSDATGSVASISAKDFNKGAITSAQELLVGKSAGVAITTNSGAPGSGATIRIRGGSSLNASNDPLVIVDGVPLDNNNVSGSSNFLSFVNPSDIESVSILKDASATAIFGSRASNGVIMITTKKGRAGAPMTVSYTGNTSLSQAIEFVDVYTGDELRQLAADNVDLFRQSHVDELGTGNTDWQNEIFRSAVSHDHSLSLSGAYKSLPYRASLGYTDQNGIMQNTDMQRITGAINLNPTFLDDDLKVNINLKATNTHQNFGDQGALGSAVNMDPTRSVYDTIDGVVDYYQWQNYGANLGTSNPVEQALEVDNRSVANRAVANVQLDYAMPFLPDLHANLNLATDISKSNGHNNRSTSSPTSLTGDFWGRLSDYTADFSNNLIDFYLNYNKDIGDHQTLDLTAGYSWQHFEREGTNYTRSADTDDEHPWVTPDSTDFIVENYLVSFFGRANYSLMDRYLLTATLRADGSSRFASGNQWGLFPSVAAAWKIYEEPFMENISALSDLKLRASYGITGQQDIGNDYPAQPLFRQAAAGSYYMIGGEWIPTLRPDPYDLFIKWEETSTMNLALDFGLFNNRIAGTVEVYHRVTNDLLNEVNVASGSNFSNRLMTNVGNMEIDGIELNLELIPISTKDMNLTLGFNGTYNKIEVTRLLLTDDPTYIGILSGSSFSGYNQITRVGSSRNAFFLNKQVYDQDDNPIEGMYVDLSGEGGTVNGDDNDKYIVEKPDPDFMFGFSARFSYKGFDVAASARASVGNYVLNMVQAGSSLNQMYQIGYWKNYTSQLDEYQFIKRQFTSDYFLENASFLKVDNISAGYTIPKITDKLNARISFSVQNALTITKYSGIDPEINGGIDNNFYPRPRTFMLGVSLTY